MGNRRNVLHVTLSKFMLNFLIALWKLIGYIGGMFCTLPCSFFIFNSLPNLVLSLNFAFPFQNSQTRDHEDYIDMLSFHIISWIGKKHQFHRTPAEHVWPHLVELKSDFKELKQKLCDYFKVKDDPNKPTSKFLLSSALHLAFVLSLPFSVT